MPVLTYAQMEGYWIKAGGPPAVAPVAAAIGEAESGGNTDALNPSDNNGRQSSYGVWQISNGTHTPPSPNWADPATNAQLAVAKYKGDGNTFGDWGTYVTGAYRAYLSPSTTPDLNVSGNPGAQTAETMASISADCLLGISGVPGTSWWNDIFGSGGNVGQMCFITRSNARGFIGAGLLVAGAVGMGLTLGLMLWIAGQRTDLGGAAVRLVQNRATGGLAGQEAQLRDQERQAAAARRAGERETRRSQQRADRRPKPIEGTLPG